jgi:hypothetical protein
VSFIFRIVIFVDTLCTHFLFTLEVKFHFSLNVPNQGLLELERLEVQFFLDFPDWGYNASNPHGGHHLLPDTESEHTSEVATKGEDGIEDVGL